MFLAILPAGIRQINKNKSGFILANRVLKDLAWINFSEFTIRNILAKIRKTRYDAKNSLAKISPVKVVCTVRVVG